MCKITGIEKFSFSFELNRIRSHWQFDFWLWPKGNSVRFIIKIKLSVYDHIPINLKANQNAVTRSNCITRTRLEKTTTIRCIAFRKSLGIMGTQLSTPQYDSAVIVWGVSRGVLNWILGQWSLFFFSSFSAPGHATFGGRQRTAPALSSCFD